MQIRGVRSAGPGDDQARFLADLRALRDSAAIGHDELAARAHYPTDILQEAENGPLLPGLPILTAYVRACEGDVLGWEERWRVLNAEVPEDPDLPVRPAGASEAAAAGARAGVSVAPPDVYDPDRIRAALRGGRAPSAGRLADRAPMTSAPSVAGAAAFTDGPAPGGTPAAPWDTAGWDPGTEPTIIANGHYPAGAEDPGLDLADAGLAGSGLAQDDGFSWLPESTPEPADTGMAASAPAAAPAPANGDFDWLKPAGAGHESAPADGNVMWSEAEAAGHLDAAVPVLPADPAADEPRPWQQDSVMKPPQRDDFWTTPGPASDLQPPAAADPVAAESVLAEPVPAEPVTAGPVTAEPATADPVAADSAKVQPQTPAHAPAHGQAPARVPQPRRPDRLLSVRLVVVIVIAALIGSALVLLLK